MEEFLSRYLSNLAETETQFYLADRGRPSCLNIKGLIGLVFS